MARTKYDEKAMRELFEAGLSTQEVAARLGYPVLGTQRVRRRLGYGLGQNHGTSKPPRTQRKIDWDRVADLTGTMSVTEIAREVGTVPRYVQEIQRQLREQGKLPPAEQEWHQPYPPEMREMARQLLEDRAGFAETARTLGVAEQTVRRWWPDLGLTDAEVMERAMLGQQEARIRW